MHLRAAGADGLRSDFFAEHVRRGTLGREELAYEHLATHLRCMRRCLHVWSLPKGREGWVNNSCFLVNVNWTAWILSQANSRSCNRRCDRRGIGRIHAHKLQPRVTSSPRRCVVKSLEPKP